MMCLGAPPGPHIADFPAPLEAAAGLALQPGFRTVANVACQEVAAGGAVLGIGIRQRCDRAPRTGRRVFPRNAGVPAALGERLAHRRTGGRKIAVLRQGGDRLVAGRGRPNSRSRVSIALAREHRVELIGEAAAAQDQSKRQRRARDRQPPQWAAAWSGEGASFITGRPQPGTRHQRVLRNGRLVPDTTPEGVNGR